MDRLKLTVTLTVRNTREQMLATDETTFDVGDDLTTLCNRLQQEIDVTALVVIISALRAQLTTPPAGE